MKHLYVPQILHLSAWYFHHNRTHCRDHFETTDEQFLFYNESYYGESIRHLHIRSGEHIGVSPLTGKKVKPSSNSAICDHLLHCNFLPSFDNFSVLAHENKKYLLEIKESLLIMRDKPSLNRNINSAPLYLFDKVS